MLKYHGLRQKTAKAKHRRVDFIRDPVDFQCALLGALGLSTSYIGKETELTPCQITYRLHKANVKRADYRNGGSAFAKRFVRTVAETPEFHRFLDSL